MLTKFICCIIIQNSRIFIFQQTKNITVEEFEFAEIDFEAGTIGTRANRYSVDVSKDGYTPISCSISYVLESTYMLPVAFVIDTTLYLNVYRAVASMPTTNKVRVKVVYIKNSNS